MSVLNVNQINSQVAGKPPIISDAAGVEVGQVCTARVKFTTVESGNVGYPVTGTVLDGFNIASVTKLSLGVYRISFTVPMLHINYSMSSMANSASLGFGITCETSQTVNTTTSFILYLKRSSTGAAYEYGDISVSVFGGK